MLECPEPYVGPRPYESAETRLFFGRDREAAEILSLVIAHPVLLLYSVSGAGKTSLINAKLAPLLSARRSQVLGPARVSGRLVGPSDESPRNVFIQNALLTLQSGSAQSAVQYESLLAFVKATPFVSPTGANAHRVLVFDQFEELFTMHADRWADREGFFADVGAALESDMRLRVVLAMREEFIASLEPYASMLPERMRIRFRLERLSKESALQAVERPLEFTTRRFGDGAANALVDALLRVEPSLIGESAESHGEFVEPLQLQIVCQDLWRSVPPDVQTIDQDRIRQLADVDKSLAKYYEYCIRSVLTGDNSSVSEGPLRRWFERVLITEHGTRSLVRRGMKSTGELPNDVLDRLDHLRLIRPEIRGHETWYELIHDRFIGPIRQSNRQWFSARPGSVRMAFLETQAAEWIAGGRRPNKLLGESEAADLARWMESSEARELGVDPLVTEFVSASEGSWRQRRAGSRLRRNLTIALLALVVVAIGLALYSISAARAQRRAEDATLVERGSVASMLAGLPGKEFDALAFGIRAVAPAVAKKTAPPAVSLDGLRSALTAVGPDKWLRGSAGPIQNVMFSPNDEAILTVSTDAVEEWDGATGQRYYSRSFHTAGSDVRPFVRYSPDGLRVIARLPLGPQAHLNAWMSRTGDTVKPLDANLQSDWFATFAADGSIMVAVGKDQPLRLRDPQSGVLVRPLTGVPRSILSVAVSPNGAFVACTAFGSPVVLWNSQNGLRSPLKGAPSGLETQVEFSKDSRYFVAATDSRILAWNVTTGAVALNAPMNASGSRSFVRAVIPVRNATVVLAHDNGIETWDVAGGRRIASYALPGNQGGQTTVLGGIGDWISYARSSGGRGSVIVLNSLSGESRLLADNLEGPLTTVDVSRDLARLIYIDAHQRARLVRLGATDKLNLSPSDLVATGCQRLQPYPEFAVVRGLCPH